MLQVDRARCSKTKSYLAEYLLRWEEQKIEEALLEYSLASMKRINKKKEPSSVLTMAPYYCIKLFCF